MELYSTIHIIAINFCPRSILRPLLKAKKILIDGLQDHLLVYIGRLENSRDIYDKLVGIYEVKNLNQFLLEKSTQRDENEQGRICAILYHESILPKGSIAICW